MPEVRVFEDLDDLVSSVGAALGPTPWRRIDEELIARFSSSVAAERGMHVLDGAESTVVRHDFLLSLIPGFVMQMRRIRGMRSGVNYGADRVVYSGVVRIGDRVRARSTVTSVEWTGPASVALVASTVVEACGCEGDCGPHPIVVRAHLLSRIYC